jgi:Protein of unknown function (DUF2934)
MKSKAVAVGTQSRDHEAAESGKTQPQLAGAPSFEEIELRAYEIYVERGRIDGFEEVDWLQAERELTEKYQKR